MYDPPHLSLSLFNHKIIMFKIVNLYILDLIVKKQVNYLNHKITSYKQFEKKIMNEVKFYLITFKNFFINT